MWMLVAVGMLATARGDASIKAMDGSVTVTVGETGFVKSFLPFHNTLKLDLH